MSESDKSKLANLFLQSEEVQAYAKQCAGCDKSHSPDYITAQVIVRPGHVSIDVKGVTLPANWQRFGEGSLCAACWTKTRSWLAEAMAERVKGGS